MEFKFVFDEKSAYYGEDKVYNLMWLVQTRTCIEDRFKLKGYVYLNQIYEAFGLKWNPKDTNPCLIYEDQKSIEIDIKRIGSRYEIIVRYS